MEDKNLTAVNQDFVRYDQVEKSHTYRLAESASDEFDNDYTIQTFDFDPYLNGDAKSRARFATPTMAPKPFASNGGGTRSR